MIVQCLMIYMYLICHFSYKMEVKYQLDGNIVRRCKDLIKSHQSIENDKT
jgi:hypothetical protein